MRKSINRLIDLSRCNATHHAYYCKWVTLTHEFAYSTYGELTLGDYGEIRFLYNGQYGVMIDENGLYYMRARYYNPEIRRFINQDILTGTIENSQSLNRYAYCQGNPVNYMDPFGLKSCNFFSELGHTVLNLLRLIPEVGDVFDSTNADWYIVGNIVGIGLNGVSRFFVGKGFIGESKALNKMLKDDGVYEWFNKFKSDTDVKITFPQGDA